ncbi:dehydratase [alpha proteobacterium AAP81b]|nr:dehydratase [alpha proteobacterium AAP81b]
MRTGSIEIAPGRFRETQGRWFEDFVVGHVYEHRPGRTISEADNSWFTLLTMNTHPTHIDAVYAARTEFGRPMVVSTLTLAILVGMSVSDVSAKAVANLGWQEVRMTAPVFAGDTLYATSEVLELRPSDSRPTQGLVTVRTQGHNQDGTLVCDFRRTMLVWRRGHGPGDA